ncbi:MAG TPA: multiheme c-type cytochrome, partial [Candidatus Brocadiales bacterium]|nr:multiheme c-type cytochrome [Candidatus Brocadiales bacterium]
MNQIRGTKFISSVITFVIVACLSSLVLAEQQPAAPQPVAPKKKYSMYDGTPDWYRNIYEKHVGMSEGSGPYTKLFKPTLLHQYWSPLRHYEPNTTLDHTIFIEKNRRDLCVLCHENVTGGSVHDWRSSTHYNPKKTPFFANKTKQIEKALGREINQVHCFDCHVDPEKKILRMPSPNECYECHPKEVEEFVSERPFGRPSHFAGWESNVVVPWYGDMAAKGNVAGLYGCDLCHASAEKCDVCHSRHSFSAAEGRKPHACIPCHMGPDHPDAETYMESKHGTMYEMHEEEFDWSKPLAQVVPGKDYKAPTCQMCHMYQGGGRYTHNFISKGVWRMGTVPPVEVAGKLKYESSLKDYPYGIKIIPPKYDIQSAANKKKSDLWIETCSKCHSPRFSEGHREVLDDFMYQAFQYCDRAQKVLDDLIADGMMYPSIADRDIYPLGDKIADLLGPERLGEGVFKAFKDNKGKVPVYGPILG